VFAIRLRAGTGRMGGRWLLRDCIFWLTCGLSQSLFELMLSVVQVFHLEFQVLHLLLRGTKDLS